MMQDIKPRYCKKTPSGQTATDIFRGLWKSAFPQQSGIQAGETNTFEDERIAWAAKEMGGLCQRSILELGPFEAYHTWQFSKLGSHPITAVEGNNINFLKCLVVKETLGIRARFLYGDIGCFLDDTTEHYDLCWACGVLYHQTNPLALLKLISKVCNAVFFWTHFFDNRIFNNPGRYPHFDACRSIERKYDGYTCTHHYRSYKFSRSEVPGLFSGGSDTFAYWLTKDDILGYLAKLGFNDVTVRGINMDHKAGPTISFLALRSFGQ